jgi:hypothetical protein
MGDVAAIERDAPAGGFDEARDHLQRGGLAAAGRTEQRNELAFFHRQVEVGDGLQLAERFRYVCEREERHGSGLSVHGHRLNRQISLVEPTLASHIVRRQMQIPFGGIKIGKIPFNEMSWGMPLDFVPLREVRGIPNKAQPEPLRPASWHYSIRE